MKIFFLLLISAVAEFAAAQTCEPSSKEMAQYLSQKSWRAVSLQDSSGIAPISGYVDDQNGFHFGDLSRTGNFAAAMTIDAKNKDFFKYCRLSSTKGDRLRFMRRSGNNNRYLVSFRFLPKIEGFSNRPFQDQNYKESEVDVEVKLGKDSIVATQEWNPSALSDQVALNLRKQVLEQPEFGLINLDLSGLDDLVCDLVQGHASLKITRIAISSAPVVQQIQVVNPQDLVTIYESIKGQIPAGANKERALFYAGRITAKLEEDRRITPVPDKKGFDILKAMMNQDMSQLNAFDASSLVCLSDRLQTYQSSSIQHAMGLKVQFPSLDDVEGHSQESNQ